MKIFTHLLAITLAIGIALPAFAISNAAPANGFPWPWHHRPTPTRTATPTTTPTRTPTATNTPTATPTNTPVAGMALYLLGSFKTPNPPYPFTSQVNSLLSLWEWSAIEPSEGVYNWAGIDAAIAAIPAGGHIALGVQPGIYTPAWVYKAGGAYSTGAAMFTSCSGDQIPVPWDSTYLGRWTTFITALGARYAGNPVISRVDLMGTYKFPSTGLPENTGTNCSDATTWLASPYQYNLITMQAALGMVAQTIITAFPNTHWVFAPQVNQWPPYTNESGTQQRQQLVDNFGTAFANTNLAWEADSAGPTFVDPVTEAAKKTYPGTILVEQAAKPCGSQIQQCLSTATAAGADDYELYPGDAPLL